MEGVARKEYRQTSKDITSNYNVSLGAQQGITKGMEAMEWKTLFIITGLCTSPSFCANYRQHCLVETPKTWIGAQSYCKERGFDLATIDDIGAMKALLPLIANQSSVWLGLYGGGSTSWLWSLADHNFYKAGERNYRNFELGSDRNYLVTSKDGIWKSSIKNKKSSLMCYDDNKQGRERYVLVLQAMDMSAARDYCRTHHTDLVSIRSAAENQEVREVAAGHEVWIGLFKDTWRWSDERYSSFRFWKLNVYTAYTLTTICGFVDLAQTGEWSLSDCGLKRPFLCTCTKTRVLKVKVRSEDLQDMSDPATKAAILKQMQQLVDKATMPGGHKMIWRTKPDGQVFTREQCHQEDCDSLN